MSVAELAKIKLKYLLMKCYSVTCSVFSDIKVARFTKNRTFLQNGHKNKNKTYQGSCQEIKGDTGTSGHNMQVITVSHIRHMSDVGLLNKSGVFFYTKVLFF